MDINSIKVHISIYIYIYIYIYIGQNDHSFPYWRDEGSLPHPPLAENLLIPLVDSPLSISRFSSPHQMMDERKGAPVR